jgi:phosphoribosylamine---glycine ligase
MSATVLVVGGGAREHALAMRLAACATVSRVVVCPGNAGIRGQIERQSGDPFEVARGLRPDLVVIGPEVPLAEGLVDRLLALGQTVFGPTRAAAQLETSKAFMKDFCVRHGIRTARHVRVESLAALDEALASFASPPVVKASGLCAGKGVVVAETIEEARQAALGMLTGDAFGESGRVIVLEERLVGEEVSIHAVSDGHRAFTLPAVQDHKRIGDGDEGPNTGGMGTYGPAPLVTTEIKQRIERDIIERVVDGMARDGVPFVGVVFAGVMVSPDGVPSLIEINARFGDPETQILVNLLDGDFYSFLLSAARGGLLSETVSVDPNKHALCVVMAASGYPGTVRSGDLITGIDDAEARARVQVYHAGTSDQGDGIRTSGGRVLSVTAVAPSLRAAKDRAYEGCAWIRFDGAQYRRDIGHRALR